MARTSEPISIAKEKPAHTYRIVLFGGSAAMGDPAPAFGPARVLEVLLETRYPGQDFEVINTAMTAINSHVVREIADDLKKINADAWILYMGNNEVYGPFGAGTVFNTKAPPLWLARAGLSIKKTKTGQLAQSLFSRLGKPPQWRGMEMFLDQQFPSDAPPLNRVYQNFRSNLGAIIASGQTSGARVIVSSVAVNLKDFPPFASEDGEAENLFQESKFTEARDQDTLRFRADSTINKIVRQKCEDARATLVDAEAGFAEDGVPGSELFFDHVHFNFAGNYRLARALAEQVAAELGLPESPAPWPGEATCAERLGLTVVHRIQQLQVMRQRLDDAPFSGQSNARERDQAMVDAITDLKATMTKTAARQAIESYGKLLGQHPEDWQLRKEFAVLLESMGKHNEASAELEKIASQLSHRPEAWYRLGAARSRGGNWAEARAAFEQAVSLKNGFHQAHADLAICLSKLGATRESDEQFTLAIKSNPAAATTWIDWGNALAQRGDDDGAVEKYESALEASPDSKSANQHLMKYYFTRGQTEKAEGYCREAIRITPRDPEAHVDMALILLKLQRQEEAIGHLQTALEIQPDNALVQKYLSELL